VGVDTSLTGEDPVMAWVDYDQLAAVYDRDRAVPLEALEPWRAALAAYLPAASGLPVLDLGAGTGLFSAAIAHWFGIDVVAVEPSEGMRRQARTRRAHHPQVAYVGGLGEQLPLRDGCCDSAWLSTVIHHLSDLAACAGELRRVVRPGGWVLIRNAFPDRPEPGSRLFTFWPMARAILARAPTVQATLATFAAAGFRMHRLEQICDQSAASLKEAYARACVRADSLLRLLPDAEFTRGLEALEQAAAAETTPTPVLRRLDLLVLQAPR
jgi:ubiquinone/menaquinone biosynthesis C-methylase UbiE